VRLHHVHQDYADSRWDYADIVPPRGLGRNPKTQVLIPAQRLCRCCWRSLSSGAHSRDPWRLLTMRS